MSAFLHQRIGDRFSHSALGALGPLLAPPGFFVVAQVLACLLQGAWPEEY